MRTAAATRHPLDAATERARNRPPPFGVPATR